MRKKTGKYETIIIPPSFRKLVQHFGFTSKVFHFQMVQQYVRCHHKSDVVVCVVFSSFFFHWLPICKFTNPPDAVHWLNVRSVPRQCIRGHRNGGKKTIIVLVDEAGWKLATWSRCKTSNIVATTIPKTMLTNSRQSRIFGWWFDGNFLWITFSDSIRALIRSCSAAMCNCGRSSVCGGRIAIWALLINRSFF